jgi:hypothetical protein
MEIDKCSLMNVSCMYPCQSLKKQLMKLLLLCQFTYQMPTLTSINATQQKYHHTNLSFAAADRTTAPAQVAAAQLARSRCTVAAAVLHVPSRACRRLAGSRGLVGQSPRGLAWLHGRGNYLGSRRCLVAVGHRLGISFGGTRRN